MFTRATDINTKKQRIKSGENFDALKNLVLTALDGLYTLCISLVSKRFRAMLHIPEYKVNNQSMVQLHVWSISLIPKLLVVNMTMIFL